MAAKWKTSRRLRVSAARRGAQAVDRFVKSQTDGFDVGFWADLAARAAREAWHMANLVLEHEARGD
jgi:hypothetical protein